MEGCWESQALLLKGPCIDLVSDRLTDSELQHWSSSSKSSRDISGGMNGMASKQRLAGQVSKD